MKRRSRIKAAFAFVFREFRGHSITVRYLRGSIDCKHACIQQKVHHRRPSTYRNRKERAWICVFFLRSMPFESIKLRIALFRVLTSQAWRRGQTTQNKQHSFGNTWPAARNRNGLTFSFNFPLFSQFGVRMIDNFPCVVVVGHRDPISWLKFHINWKLYGFPSSGFPRGLQISRPIDRWIQSEDLLSIQFALVRLSCSRGFAFYENLRQCTSCGNRYGGCAGTSTWN